MKKERKQNNTIELTLYKNASDTYTLYYNEIFTIGKYEEDATIKQLNEDVENWIQYNGLDNYIVKVIYKF